jgi:putative endonuclease
MMTFPERIRALWTGNKLPLHLRHGALGERAARKYLQRQGMKFLTANFRSKRGEIDLIFRADDSQGLPGGGRIPLMRHVLKWMRKRTSCLVFVEVKTRSSEDWVRPAAAVDAGQRRRISQCALDYLRLLKNPPVKIRFDIVEVLLQDGAVREIRHLPNTFVLSAPYRYG